MKTSLTFAVTLGTIITLVLCTCSENDDSQQCNELDYMRYVQCIRRKLRLKRAADCEDNCVDTENCLNTCNDCNCEYCSSNTCENFCSRCCQSTTCRTSSCCHRTCHAQCRTSRCRHECKRDCTDNIEQQQQQVDVETGNITTIITLHTAINNTNIIDVPISINNTNVNNFTLDSSFAYPEYQPLPEKIIVVNTTTSNNQQCCNVVGQPNCMQSPSWPFFNCSRPVTEQCGPFCTSPVVHTQPIRNCMHGNCMNQMMYIPQPRPRCIHHPIWPYISCGMPQQPFCGGCYDHYNSPFQLPFSHCSSACYDEGFGLGPYYRQGPFYRRSFGHVPSCYQMGNCYEMGYGYSETSAPWGYDFPQMYPPIANYPFVDNGDDSNVLTTYFGDGIQVQTLDKSPNNPTPSTTKPKPSVTVEAQVNSTKPQKLVKNSNKATVTIEKTKK